MADLSGRDAGRYHIIEKLGQGGMATVYRAFDTRLEREVALKVIRREAIGAEFAEQLHKRFDREAKSLAALDHMHIVKVFDYGDFEGSPYLVMQYIPGGMLKAVTGKPIPYPQAARLLAKIALALEYAHKRGVIHRDIKPANILMSTDGEPMLSDFGIAKLLETTDATLTGTGVGIGTPEYMAPEQGMGHTIDHRADIYALGVVFYEMVTGRKPYTADTPMAVVLKQVTQPLPRPTSFNPDLPDSVEQVLFKALAKEPSDRYEDMGKFAQALEQLASQAEATTSAGSALPEAALSSTVQRTIPQPETASPQMPPQLETVATQVSYERIQPGGVATQMQDRPTAATQVDTSLKSTRVSTQGLATSATVVELPAQKPRTSRLPLILGIAAVVVILGAVVIIGGAALLSSLVKGTPVAEVLTSIPTQAPAPTEAPAAVSTLPPPPTEVPAAVPSGSNIKACLIPDTGPINDGSFNSMSWQGVQTGMGKLGIQGFYLESPNGQADWDKNFMAFLDQGCQLIIPVGFSFTDLTPKYAASYPDTHFATVDVFYDPPMSNVLGSSFAVEQAAFLNGYLAAGMTGTGVVGTYGGMNIPPVVAFMDGFARGVGYYNATHGTQVQVIGWDPGSQQGLFINSFAAGAAAETMTMDLLGKGADIIFPVAGPAGESSLKVLKSKATGMLIGVDSDWSITYPDYAGFVLSSVVKRMDTFTLEAILMETQGNFKGGMWEGNLANGGVGIAYGSILQGKIPDTLKKEIEVLMADIINGNVKVK